MTRLFLLGLGTLGLGTLAAATALAATDTTPALVFEKYTLANGLEIILSEDHRVPLVSTNIWYHVGAGYEVPGRSGFAHLFEHIMFQGSRNVAEDTFFKYLEQAGAPLVNGTTDFDRTNYFETVPSNQLELALWLESDRMGFLLDTLTQERLDNQKAVVRKERQQSVENVPYGTPEEKLIQMLYPAPHPYYGVVIGTHEDLEAATLEDVRAFFQTWYVPNNATMAVVGDFDPKTVRATIEKYFGSIPAGPEPVVPPSQTKPITAERRATIPDEVELPRVYLSWITSPIYQPGDAELQIAASVLADGRSSRLYEALVVNNPIAQEVKAEQYPLTQGSIFWVVVTGKAGQSLETLEAETWKVVEGLRTAPPSVEEVQRAQRSWEAETLRGLERLGGFGGKADVLNTYNHHLNDPGFLPKDFERMRAVTPAAVQKAVSEQIRTDNRVVVLVPPIAEGAK